MKVRKYIFLSFFLLNIKAFGQEAVVPSTVKDSNMVKQLFFAGLREKMNENYPVAINNFSKVVSIDPNSDAARYELANANLRMDKLAEAEVNIKQAITLNTNNKWYYMLLAEIYKRNHHMAELIDVLNRLIQLDPENDSYYFDRANAQLISGQQDQAKKTYDIIEDKFGESKQLIQARQQLQKTASVSESDLLKLLEGNQASVKNYIYAAGLLMQKGNYTEALKVLTRAQRIEPDSYEINLALADVYKQQKNDELIFSQLKLAFSNKQMPLDEKIKILLSFYPRVNQSNLVPSITDLSYTLVLNYPTEAKVLALYGDVLYHQNKFKEALVQYEAALKQGEQIYGVWEQVINIQTLLGHYSDAVKMADEALSIYPNQASLYYYLGYALFKTGQSEKALSNLTTALQLDIENKSLKAQVYALQGDIYINQNNFAQAKTAFEKAIDMEPDNYLIMNNYAYYLALRNDDLLKASQLAQAAAQGLPNSPSVADTYAFVLFKQQKYSQAQQWIEKALQNNSAKNGVYLERYGDILYMLGNKGDAVLQWQKAKEAGNDSEILNKKINEKKYFK